VWVVVLSNVIAILLQTLAARLGLVTGKHLAQASYSTCSSHWQQQQQDQKHQQ
jgi:manganese transport protein